MTPAVVSTAPPAVGLAVDPRSDAKEAQAVVDPTADPPAVGISEPAVADPAAGPQAVGRSGPPAGDQAGEPQVCAVALDPAAVGLQAVGIEKQAVGDLTDQAAVDGRQAVGRGAPTAVDLAVQAAAAAADLQAVGKAAAGAPDVQAVLRQVDCRP